MSLMDDVFDIRDALKGKPEQATFDRFCERMWELEEAHNEAMDVIDTLRAGARTLVKLINPTEYRNNHD